MIYLFINYYLPHYSLTSYRPLLISPNIDRTSFGGIISSTKRQYLKQIRLQYNRTFFFFFKDSSVKELLNQKIHKVHVSKENVAYFRTIWDFLHWDIKETQAHLPLHSQ